MSNVRGGLFNEQLEIGILFICLNHGRSAMKRITTVIEPDDFYFPKYASIWKVMRELYVAGEAIDIVIVSDKIGRKTDFTFEDLLRIDGFSLGMNLYCEVTPACLNTYAKMLKEYSVARRAALQMEHGAHVIKNHGDAEETISDTIQSTSGLRDELAIHTTPSLEESFDTTLGIVEARKSGELKIVKTGIDPIDSKLGGFLPSEFVVIGGRPSMGKSDLALNIAYWNAKDGVKVQFQSLEMSMVMAMSRLFSLQTGIFRAKYRSGSLSDDEMIKTKDAKKEIAKLSLSLVAPNQIPLSRIRSLAVEERARNGLELLVIDYLGYIVPTTAKGKSREQEVAEISKGLKALAQELMIPVVCVSQLSRAAETRDNPIPQLSDLRESGQVEQDCDIAIFPYRESYYEGRKKNIMTQTNPTQDILDLYVLKNRNGETMVIKGCSYNRGTGHIGVGNGKIVVGSLYNENPDPEDYPKEWREV